MTRVNSPQLVPDLLTEPVEVEELVGSNTDLIQAVEQTEIAEVADRVGKDVDAHAELAHRARLLVDLTLDAALVTGQRRGQAADAGTHDQRFHTWPCHL